MFCEYGPRSEIMMCSIWVKKQSATSQRKELTMFLKPCFTSCGNRNSISEDMWFVSEVMEGGRKIAHLEMWLLPLVMLRVSDMHKLTRWICGYEWHFRSCWVEVYEFQRFSSKYMTQTYRTDLSHVYCRNQWALLNQANKQAPRKL